jgi:hypothetical protein
MARWCLFVRRALMRIRAPTPQVPTAGSELACCRICSLLKFAISAAPCGGDYAAITYCTRDLPWNAWCGADERLTRFTNGVPDHLFTRCRKAPFKYARPSRNVSQQARLIELASLRLLYRFLKSSSPAGSNANFHRDSISAYGHHRPAETHQHRATSADPGIFDSFSNAIIESYGPTNAAR